MVAGDWGGFGCQGKDFFHLMHVLEAQLVLGGAPPFFYRAHPELLGPFAFSADFSADTFLQ